MEATSQDRDEYLGILDWSRRDKELGALNWGHKGIRVTAIIISQSWCHNPIENHVPVPFTDITENLYKSLVRLLVILIRKLFGISKGPSGSETGEGMFHLIGLLIS